MENTPNYNLNLPDYEDFADVEKLNENFEIIDTQMKSTEVALTTHLDENKQYYEFTKANDQSIPNSQAEQITVANKIPFHGADFCDINENGRIVALQKGIYEIFVTIRYAANANGYRSLAASGATTLQNAAQGSSNSTYLTVSAIDTLVNGQLFNIATNHTAGSPLNIMRDGTIVKIRKVADL